jgi:hypothetical protein
MKQGIDLLDSTDASRPNSLQPDFLYFTEASPQSAMLDRFFCKTETSSACTILLIKPSVHRKNKCEAVSRNSSI